MDKSIDFYLVSSTPAQDDIGQYVPGTPTKRKVYGQVMSVSADEFFAAGQNGITPDWRITMFAPDYQGEQDLEMNGVPYTVYRTYHRRDDIVELYVERRRGDVVQEEQDGNDSEP